MNKLFHREGERWTATGPWKHDADFVPTIKAEMPELQPGDWHWMPVDRDRTKISFRTKELADRFISTGLFVRLV